jgi:hypothetical protein
VKDGPVETFLVELGHRLRRHEAARGRVVAEAGDHLRDLVDEGRTRGLEECEAEREAVERFGSPRAFARAMRPARRRRSLRIVAAVAAASVAGALTVAGLRDASPPIGIPQTDVTALLPAGKVVGCVAQLRASSRPAPGRRVPRANSVVIDPRTGRILKCGLLVVSFVGRDPRYGPVVTRPVTFQVALHQ